MSKINVIDVFSGAGGLSKGFENAGFNIIAGIDNDEESLEKKSTVMLFLREALFPSGSEEKLMSFFFFFSFFGK